MGGLPGPHADPPSPGDSHARVTGGGGTPVCLSRSGRATAKADAPVGWRVQRGRAASGTVPSQAQEGTGDGGRKPPREPPQRRGVATRRRAKTRSQGVGGYRAALGRGSAVRIATARSLFIGEKIISVSISSKRL